MLLSTLLHAIAYVYFLYTFLHNLLNVLVQIAKKWDYKKISAYLF
jgi:hypothetical protein